MGKLEDISGQRFGKLVVLELVGRDKSRHTIWKCQCDCGNVANPLATSLKAGKTRSCGCGEAVIFSESRKEQRRKPCKAHPLYSIFGGMKLRCLYSKASHYPRYGGRGITICQEWLDNPEIFVEYGLANGWKEGLQIDRIDNDGNYEPGNCRFVTNRENANNSSKNVTFSINGTELLWVDIEWMSRVSKNSFMNRIYRGWGTLDALITPPCAPNSFLARRNRSRAATRD